MSVDALEPEIATLAFFDMKAWQHWQEKALVCCALTDLCFRGLGALFSQGLDVVPKRIPAPRWPGVHRHQDPFAAQDISLACLNAYPRDLRAAKAYDSSDEHMNI